MPKAILLVEDDPEQSGLFQQVLSLAGFDVTIVTSGVEAQALLRRSAFSLMLADWDLDEGMQGDELIAWLKAKNSAIKAILFSNHSQVDQAAARCGADAWFRKMDGIATLRDLVKTQLS